MLHAYSIRTEIKVTYENIKNNICKLEVMRFLNMQENFAKMQKESSFNIRFKWLHNIQF